MKWNAQQCLNVSLVTWIISPIEEIDELFVIDLICTIPFSPAMIMLYTAKSTKQEDFSLESRLLPTR